MITSDMTNKDIKINAENRRSNIGCQKEKNKNIFVKIVSFFFISNKKCKCGGK